MSQTRTRGPTSIDSQHNRKRKSLSGWTKCSTPSKVMQFKFLPNTPKKAYSCSSPSCPPLFPPQNSLNLVFLEVRRSKKGSDQNKCHPTNTTYPNRILNALKRHLFSTNPLSNPPNQVWLIDLIDLSFHLLETSTTDSMLFRISFSSIFSDFSSTKQRKEKKIRTMKNKSNLYGK